jgi:hypothetical protein
MLRIDAYILQLDFAGLQSGCAPAVAIRINHRRFTGPQVVSIHEMIFDFLLIFSKQETGESYYKEMPPTECKRISWLLSHKHIFRTPHFRAEILRLVFLAFPFASFRLELF